VTAERVNELLEHIDRLPAALGDWLARGFAQWQRGGDLQQALELDCEIMSYDERDRLLRACIELCPGADASDRLSYFVGMLARGDEHSDATGRQMLAILRRSRAYVPTSRKHYRDRILKGHRGTESGSCPVDEKLENALRQFFYGARRSG
jgi:hypothetical protein